MRLDARRTCGVELATAALLVCAPACSVITRVDVCERRGAPEHDVNTRTEGDQMLSPQALSAIPRAGGFVVIASRDVASGRSEIRGARIGADARLMPTCESEAEITYATRGSADLAAIAFPATAGEPGVLAFRQTDAAGQLSVWAIPITENGCANLFGATDPVQVATIPAGTLLTVVRAVALGTRRFVISWLELRTTGTTVESHLRARVLSLEVPFRFLPTVAADDGSAVDLPPDGDLAGAHAIVPAGAGRFGLVWMESGVAVFRVRIAMFDDRLAPLAGPRLVSERAVTELPAQASVAGSFDGSQFLAAWVFPDELGAARVYGRFFDDHLQALRTSRSPDGAELRLGSLDAGGETNVALTSLSGGGFLAAWTERDTLGRTDSSGTGLRAAAFDATGEVQFANRACDRADFPLNLDTVGDQTDPSLATLDDGTVLALWNNVGGATDDRSGLGARGVALSPHDLFPR